MKAKAILVVNAQVVDDAIKQKESLGLGVEIPEFEYGEFDFLFNIYDIKFAYISPRKHIMLLVVDEWFEIKFNQDIWDELIKRFK